MPTLKFTVVNLEMVFSCCKHVLLEQDQQWLRQRVWAWLHGLFLLMHCSTVVTRGGQDGVDVGVKGNM